MPAFKIHSNNLTKLEIKQFKREKELQSLVEENLLDIFKVRLVSSEFIIKGEHNGRIDTLGLGEDDSPVIIEYKLKEKSDLINQSLFYYDWLDEHRDDFEIECQKQLGKQIEVDWSDIRVVCLAQGFKKYDIHAVKRMNVKIELWQYQLFRDNFLYLEQINSLSSSHETMPSKQGLQNSTFSNRKDSYNIEQHYENKPDPIPFLFKSAREYILGLGDHVKESPRKLYVAYRTSQIFACIEVQTKKLIVYLKLDYQNVPPVDMARDVSNIGHFGTGNYELTIKNDSDFEKAKPYIEMSFKKFE